MTRRQKTIAFFVTLCVLLVAAAVSLNVGWILISGRRLAALVFGMVLFGLIIAAWHLGVSPERLARWYRG